MCASVVTFKTTWEKPDAYDSDADVEESAKINASIELKFDTDFSLLSELIRMRFIHASSDEIEDILSGNCSDRALTKLRILQDHCTGFGTESDWTIAVRHDHFNLLSYLLMHMNIYVHESLKECASRCLAFLTTMYPKLWYDYMTTMKDTSNVYSNYVVLNIILLLHTAVNQITSQLLVLFNAKIEDRQNNKGVNNLHYIGFDERDIAEYNMRFDEQGDCYVNNTKKAITYSATDTCTHGIVGMEDVCDCEASVRIWLLLLSQVFNYVPVFSDLYENSPGLNLPKEAFIFVPDEYVYEPVEEVVGALHELCRRYFVSSTSAEAAKALQEMNGYIVSIGAFDNDKESTSALIASNNEILHKFVYRKLIVRCCDVMIRHAKYYSNESYPLCIKYIATVSYQLQQHHIMDQKDKNEERAPELPLIVDILYNLHFQDPPINISEIFLHLLNENGYPYQDCPDTIPCIRLCSDLLVYNNESTGESALDAYMTALSESIQNASTSGGYCGGCCGSNSTSEYSYFYTNDMRVIIDIVVRELSNLPSSANAAEGEDGDEVPSCLANTSLSSFNALVKAE